MKEKRKSKAAAYKELWKRVMADPFYSDFLSAVWPDEEMRHLTPYIKWKSAKDIKIIGKPRDP